MVVCFFAVRFLSCLSCFFFFFFFSCNIEAGAPGRHERVYCDVVRARGTLHGCFFLRCASCCACLGFFVFLFVLLVTTKRARQADMRECLSQRSEGGGTEHDC